MRFAYRDILRFVRGGALQVTPTATMVLGAVSTARKEGEVPEDAKQTVPGCPRVVRPPPESARSSSSPKQRPPESTGHVEPANSVEKR